jgi:hypothetical protein
MYIDLVFARFATGVSDPSPVGRNGRVLFEEGLMK